MNNTNDQLTLAAAREVRALADNGYHGIAVLSDLALGHVAILRIDHQGGAQRIGQGHVSVMPETTPELLPLPGLIIPVNTGPVDAFHLAEAYIRQRTAHFMN
ncbi:MAG TPA: hypothetical protein VF271_03020 [Rhodanobacteraceae bacterium]|nr:hypothetical protein [Oleiagrimonas sp.]